MIWVLHFGNWSRQSDKQHCLPHGQSFPHKHSAPLGKRPIGLKVAFPKVEFWNSSRNLWASKIKRKPTKAWDQRARCVPFLCRHMGYFQFSSSWSHRQLVFPQPSLPQYMSAWGWASVVQHPGEGFHSTTYQKGKLMHGEAGEALFQNSRINSLETTDSHSNLEPGLFNLQISTWTSPKHNRPSGNQWRGSKLQKESVTELKKAILDFVGSQPNL